MHIKIKEREGPKLQKYIYFIENTKPFIKITSNQKNNVIILSIVIVHIFQCQELCS